MKLVGKCFGFIGKDFEMIGRWVCRDTDGFHDGPTDHLPIINNRWARIFFEGVDATVFFTAREITWLLKWQSNGLVFWKLRV